MVGTSKQKKHMKKITDKSLEARRTLVDKGIRAAFAAILSGITFSTYFILSFLLGVEPVNKYWFDIGVKKVTEVLYDSAIESVQKHFEAMPPQAKLSFDASWSHRRNAKLCVADFIDIDSGKIVAFSIINKFINDEFNNYEGPSNLMEARGFEDLLPFLKASGKVGTIIKDGDVKIEKLIEKYNWTVKVMSDVNHKFKNFHTSFKKINDAHNGKLRGLEKGLKQWLGHILFSNLSTIVKEELWNNTVNHYLGNHANCIQHGPVKNWKNAKDPDAVKALQEVIDLWYPTVRDFIRGETTNFNENFHSVKARFLNKVYNYGKSSEARICASILQYNEGYSWILDALKKLHANIISVHGLAGITGFLSKTQKKVEKKKEKYHENNEALDKKRQKEEEENKLESKKTELSHN